MVERKRHFLYYIFQFDKSECIIQKETILQIALYNILQKINQGD